MAIPSLVMKGETSKNWKLNSQSSHMRNQIRAELQSITPFDAIEQAHLSDAFHWVDSGAELYRLAKPATPPKHLVSYFAVVDGENILLVDHKNAKLWLPSGGHVEPQEHPRSTVERELKEELGFDAPHPIGAPVMLTCTETVGSTAGHEDVSLWYVINASRQQEITFDQSEFFGVRWFPFAEIPYACTDPHMRRFIAKLQATKPFEIAAQ